MFGIVNYWAFVVAVIVFLAIPGPGNLAIITATSKGRLAGGVAATAGIIAGDQLLIWLAVAGLAKMLTSNPAVFSLVQYVGAAYLVYLGLRMIIAKPDDAPVLKMAPRHFLRQSMLITVLNPKAIVFYMAFFPLFVDPARHQGLATFAAMAITVACLTLLYCLIVALVTHLAAERMRASPRVSGWLNKLAGTMLVGFGVKLAISK